MPFDVNKYQSKKKKRTLFDVWKIKQKWWSRKCKRKYGELDKHNECEEKRQEKLEENKETEVTLPRWLTNIISFVLKFIGYFILFCIVTFLFNEDFKLSVGWYIFGFLYTLNYYYTAKTNYKSWLSRAEYDIFYNNFCKQYSVPFFYLYVVLWFANRFCNNGGIYLLVIYSATLLDLWERRYLTNDIKQDMILRRLENERS